MKKSGRGLLPVFAVVLLALLACGLRRLLYLSCVDSKGLLIRLSPPEIGLYILTAELMAVLGLLLWQRAGSHRTEDCCGRSIWAALGHLAAAAGIALTVLSPLSPAAGHPGSLWKILGMAAPVCLALAGAARLLGKKPFFLLHAVPCLFFMLHIVVHYRFWSSDPQMQNHLFALLGAMMLAFFSYHTAAFEADAGTCRPVTVTGLAAFFFCMAELGWTLYPALYLGGALWALTGIGRLCPPQSREE